MDQSFRPIKSSLFSRFLGTLSSVSFLGIIVLLPGFAHSAKKEVRYLAESTTSISKMSESGYGLRKLRRVGLSTTAAGAYGLIGTSLELNLTPTNSAVLGFGTGDKFQTVLIQWKSYFSGQQLLPFLGLGFTRWANFSNKKSIEQTYPSFLSERLMNDSDKRAGLIDENLVFPSIGLQYLQLSGPWAGFGMSAEILILVDIGEFQAAPTGGVSVHYFF